MPTLQTIETLLAQEIKNLYSAETQLVKALPKMAKAAANPQLRTAFEQHIEETKDHVDRLDRIAKSLDTSPGGKLCKAMKALIEESSEVISQDGDPVVKALALIVTAQKVEHYEIAGYGSARALAEALGHDEVAELLQETLDEEDATDKKLAEAWEAISSRSSIISISCIFTPWINRCNAISTTISRAPREHCF